MKKYILTLNYLILSSLLSGCSIVDYLGYGMLNVAPSGTEDLKYPEWGSVPKDTDSMRSSTKFQQQKATLSQLTSYLAEQKISYMRISDDEHSSMIILTDLLHFATNLTSLSEKSQDNLRKLTPYLALHSNIEVIVEGHSDATGKANYNRQLSAKRAQTVKNQLMAVIPSSQLFTRSYGDLLARCNNYSEQGKKCNRRVDLILVLQKN